MDLKTRLFINQHLIEQNQDKGTGYVLSWESKGVYNPKHNALYTAFLHSRKLCGYQLGIKFDKNLSAVELNNYECKIVNVYIVYDLDGQDILVTISNLRTVHLEETASAAKNIDKESMCKVATE